MENLNQSIQKADESQKLLLPGAEAQFEKYFNKITELRAGDIIVKPHCKLCNHPLRAEAEEKWELTKGNSGRGSYTMVIKFLNSHADEYDGVKFNHQNVSVHINNHYEQQLKRVWMREYGKDLQQVLNYRINKEEMFEGIIQSLQLKLFEIAAIPGLDIAKQADMMAKLSKQISETAITQAKLRGDLDTLDIYKEKVRTIFVKFIAAEPDLNRQRELLERLDHAKAEVSDNM